MTEAPSAWTIENVMSVALATVSRLREEDGEIITDDAELFAALSAEGADVQTIVRRLVRASQEAKADAASVAARIADLGTRKARFAKREEAYRAALFAIMDALGLTTMKEAEFSLSISAGRAMPVVADEAALPETYWQTTRSIDKAAINADAKAGIVIPGVEMSNGAPSLTIRSK